MENQSIINNMNPNGGGLAVNITGRYESNRHALARNEKFTFGEVSKELRKKKNGGFDISSNKLLEIYRDLFGEPEWHHAGFLPKSYGGGMKKTYFLDEVPTKETFESWLIQHENFKNTQINEGKRIVKIQNEIEKFVKKNGCRFNRLTEVPKYSVITETEMNGKYGWFTVTPYTTYNLTKYYSGVQFKSKKSLEKYISLKKQL